MGTLQDNEQKEETKQADQTVFGIKGDWEGLDMSLFFSKGRLGGAGGKDRNPEA